MDDYGIPDFIAENHHQAHEAGTSWADIAAQFDRDAAALPAEHAAPYRQLAAWARAQATAAGEELPAEAETTETAAETAAGKGKTA